MSLKQIILLGLSAMLFLACGPEPAPSPAADPANTPVVATGEAGQTSTPPAAQEPFVIGAMDSLTGVGETYGVPLSQSKLLAVEEINAAGGINGRMLKLVIEDSKCTANDAIIAYNRLTDVEGIKIILGATCSGGMLGAAPLAEKDGVILFSPSSTSPDITNPATTSSAPRSTRSKWASASATPCGQTESANWPRSPRPRTTSRAFAGPPSGNSSS